MVKIRKKRKPMTPEQRAAAGERLAKARAKRQAANPPQYKYIHESVLARGEDDPLPSISKVILAAIMIDADRIMVFSC